MNHNYQSFQNLSNFATTLTSLNSSKHLKESKKLKFDRYYFSSELDFFDFRHFIVDFSLDSQTDCINVRLNKYFL